MGLQRKRYSALLGATLPVLVKCALQKEDGFIFLRRERDNVFVPVRVLPLSVLERAVKFKKDGPLQTRYGTISQGTRAALLMDRLLIQEIQDLDGKGLDKYVRLKTVEEASEEARQSDLYEYGLGELAFKEERERLEPEMRKRVLARVKGEGHPIAELSAELYLRASAHLVLWWRSKERNLKAGLYCLSLDAALFALLLSRIDMPQNAAICTRCQKVYTRSRRAQKFCSRRCGNAVRQARRRAIEKKNLRGAHGG